MVENKVKEDKPTLPIKEDYESIEINGFRGIKHLKIDNLGKVNLILGKSASGKTTLLEAFNVLGLGANPVFITKLALDREIKPINTISPMYAGEHVLNLFNNFSSEYKFDLKAKMNGSLLKTFEQKISFEPAPFLRDIIPESFKSNVNFKYYLGGRSDMEPNMNNPSLEYFLKTPLGKIKFDQGSKNFDYVLSIALSIEPMENYQQVFKISSGVFFTNHRNPYPDMSIFSVAKRSGKIIHYIEFMKKQFGDIDSIEFIPYPNGQNGDIYVIKNDKSLLPISNYGDGFRKIAMLTIDLMQRTNTVFTIDEVDINLHYSLQREFSKMLVDIALETQNQIFMTTHSLEFADNFLSALYDEGNEFGFTPDNDPVRVITLQRDENGDEIKAWNSTGKDAYYSRNELGLELR